MVETGIPRNYMTGSSGIFSTRESLLLIDIPRLRNSMALETVNLRKWQNRELSSILLQLFMGNI